MENLEILSLIKVAFDEETKNKCFMSKNDLKVVLADGTIKTIKILK